MSDFCNIYCGKDMAKTCKILERKCESRKEFESYTASSETKSEK